LAEICKSGSCGMVYQVCLLVVTAFCWGVTNPLLKQGGLGVDNITSDGWFKSVLAKAKFLFLNWKCVAPMVTNQFGSLLYYLTLSETGI